MKTNFQKCELVPRVDNALFQHACLIMDTLVWNYVFQNNCFMPRASYFSSLVRIKYGQTCTK